MRLLKWITLGIFALVVLVFALSNRQPLALSFFPFEDKLELPAYLFFFLTLMVGIALGGILTMLEKLREIVVMKRKDQTINALKNEVEALKTEKKIADTYQKSDNTRTAAITHVN